MHRFGSNTLLISFSAGFILLIFSMMSFGISQREEAPWSAETPVSEVLYDIGEKKPKHFIEYNEELVRQGRQLVVKGKIDGGKYVSRYYVCTSCHNIAREDADLTVVDPDGRLKYAMKNNIPYLQATTFWGTVNRETWYNDDYVKKYGDLVKKATNDLIESIQLCASVCSQGRLLTDDEMKATLAYLWSLEMKLKDLGLKENELRMIMATQTTRSTEGVAELIKSKYMKKSPATFGKAPESLKDGYALKGRPEMGKAIYELGCKHCHRPGGTSDVIFDDGETTFRWFMRNITKNSKLSLYNILRYGTFPIEGHKEYMPHYTLEKMSDQQVEDLRAYIELKANGN